MYSFCSYDFYILFIYLLDERSVISFFLKEELLNFDRNKLLNFKTALCKSLKLVPSEVSWIGKTWGTENKIIFQLPCEVVPLLRHCTAWKKDWLFSLGVKGIQVNKEDFIAVIDIRVSQLRLQEDPGNTIYCRKTIHLQICSSMHPSIYPFKVKPQLMSTSHNAATHRSYIYCN